MSPRLAPPPPARNLLKEQAYARLKELILDETFPPGTFLSERQLAERLKMSKTPIRAALTRLEEDGLVTVSPQQGIVVRELTLPEVQDHFEIRLALESYIVRALAGRLTATQTARLEENLASERKSVEREDVAGIVRADTQFHLLFCEFLGNQEIQKTMNRLRDKVERVIRRVLTQDLVRCRAAHAEHRAIADAVLSGDGGQAAQRMVEHLEFGQRLLLSPRRGTERA